MHAFIHIYVYVHMYVHVYVCMYICPCVYIYICMCTYSYLCINTQVPSQRGTWTAILQECLKSATFQILDICTDTYMMYMYTFIVSYCLKMQVSFRKRATNYRALLHIANCNDPVHMGLIPSAFSLGSFLLRSEAVQGGENA